jgi:signal transduction histidine kinase
VTTPQEPLAGLLRAVLVRVEDLVAGEKRVRSLLDAVTAVAGDLDLHATLERIVAAAAGLADAEYAALGVIDPSGEGLVDFITVGMSAQTVAGIGSQPRGHGILGLIIAEPQPLRLHDLSEHPASYGIPAHHPPMQSFLGVPVRARSRVFGNLYLTDKIGGGDFTIEDEQAVVALAAAAGVAIENARLFERLTRREKWLAGTAEIQQALLGQVDITSALALIATRARELAASDICVIVLEQDDGSLEVVATAGADDDLLSSSLPRSGSMSDVIEHGATVILVEGVRLPGLEGVESALLVPFTGPGGAGGALLVGSGEHAAARTLDEDDIQALRGFAAQAALGVDRAQAQEDRAALALLADRDRIARDLHDLVIQRLFATGLTLHSLARRPENSALAGPLTAMVDDLDATIRDIRGTIFELGRDGAGDDLKSQISAVVTAAVPLLGTRPHVEFVGPVDAAVPDSVRPHLVAVVVEALSNVGRHAEAAVVSVAVAIEGTHPAMVSVEICDDGRGFVPQQRGSGLRNLRDRATELGGSCEIASVVGEGTTIRWVVPLGQTLVTSSADEADQGPPYQ